MSSYCHFSDDITQRMISWYRVVEWIEPNRFSKNCILFQNRLSFFCSGRWFARHYLLPMAHLSPEVKSALGIYFFFRRWISCIVWIRLFCDLTIRSSLPIEMPCMMLVHVWYNTERRGRILSFDSLIMSNHSPRFRSITSLLIGCEDPFLLYEMVLYSGMRCTHKWRTDFWPNVSVRIRTDRCFLCCLIPMQKVLQTTICESRDFRFFSTGILIFIYNGSTIIFCKYNIFHHF